MESGCASYLDELQAAADGAADAETAFRRESAQRIAALERERTFAFRRLNFVRGVAGAVSGAEDAEAAVASALGILRAQLDWSSASAARDAVLARFTPVAQAIFAAGAPAEQRSAQVPDVRQELAAFETWYAETHAGPFWNLFENYLRETPVVDF
jgi:hypothetical protein